MTQDDLQAAAAVMVEAEVASRKLAELHGLLGSCFSRVEPFRQAGKYPTGLMSDLPRKNAWTIAEYVGDATPDRMRRLLNRAVWDTDAAMATVRRFVVDRLAPTAGELAVAALDETGQQKQGTATVGVKRQYLGCAGRVAGGVNTVHCSYATVGGHALISARLYLPADQLEDPTRRARCGIPAEVEFQTTPRLAIEITAEMIAEGTMAPWAAGDEVYGRSAQLRKHREDHQVGYVPRVGSAFHLRLPHATTTIRADALLAKELRSVTRWQTLSVPESKGDRSYAWAWVATASPQHSLLIRKHCGTGEVAYHYCYVPPGRSVTLMTLVRVACPRWPVEEGFEFSKDHFVLDHSQVRGYTALPRHTVLTMAALAVCAVTAAHAAARTPNPPPPTHPDQPPPADPGLIALTVAEVTTVQPGHPPTAALEPSPALDPVETPPPSPRTMVPPPHPTPARNPTMIT